MTSGSTLTVDSQSVQIDEEVQGEAHSDAELTVQISPDYAGPADRQHFERAGGSSGLNGQARSQVQIELPHHQEALDQRAGLNEADYQVHKMLGHLLRARADLNRPRAGNAGGIYSQLALRAQVRRWKAG